MKSSYFSNNLVKLYIPSNKENKSHFYHPKMDFAFAGSTQNNSKASDMNTKLNNEKRVQIEKMLEDFKFSKKSREKEQKESPQPQNIKNFQSVPGNSDSHLIFKKSMEVSSSPKKALQDQEDIQINKEGNEVNVLNDKFS